MSAFKPTFPRIRYAGEDAGIAALKGGSTDKLRE
jgi:hypothetical protein